MTHQTLVGFGAATAYQSYLLAGRTDDIFQVLFVDSGLDILRLGNWYQNQGQTDTTTAFSDNDAVQIVQKATAARGGTPPKILMSSWTPPAYLKSNGVTRPPFGSGVERSGRHPHPERRRLCLRGFRRLVGAFAAGLRGGGGGARLDQHSKRTRLLHQPVGDLRLRPHRRCHRRGHRRRRLRAGPGRRLGRDSGRGTWPRRPSCSARRPPGSSGNIVQQYLNGLDPSKLGGIAHHLYGSTEDNPGPDTFNAIAARLWRARARRRGCRPS